MVVDVRELDIKNSISKFIKRILHILYGSIRPATLRLQGLLTTNGRGRPHSKKRFLPSPFGVSFFCFNSSFLTRVKTKKVSNHAKLGASLCHPPLSSSVILATRNRLPNVLTFLDSLATQTVQPNELVIVDSSDKKLSADERFVARFSKKHFPKSKLVYRHTAPGLTRQRNVGVARASAKILHFLDDDTILDPTYLERMNTIFVQHPEYAGGMGTIKDVQKRPAFNRVLRKIFLLQRDHSRGNFTVSGMPTHAYGTSTFKRVQVLGGCCMSYRSWIFKTYRFDETLSRYSYMEDCDFSRRVSYEYPLFFNPLATLEHRHSPLSRDRIEDNRALYIKNYSYLFFKNFYPRNRLTIIAYWWSVTGLFFEALVMRNKDYLRGYWKGLKQYSRGR